MTKIALVTGGSRGLGKDMVINLAKKGLDIIFTYNNNKTEADKVIAEVNALGQKAAAYQLNVSDPASFDAFIEKATAHLEENTGSPNFDFLVNNAGFIHHGILADISEQPVSYTHLTLPTILLV